MSEINEIKERAKLDIGHAGKPKPREEAPNPQIVNNGTIGKAIIINGEAGGTIIICGTCTSLPQSCGTPDASLPSESFRGTWSTPHPRRRPWNPLRRPPGRRSTVVRPPFVRRSSADRRLQELASIGCSAARTP
ncbi:MAG: hypothetical protein WD100_04175, partial [Tistlia sp.]